MFSRGGAGRGWRVSRGVDRSQRFRRSRMSTNVASDFEANEGDLKGLRGRSIVAAHGDMAMIGVGIVGCNYGRTVLVPAFRHDPRCEIVALGGTDAARTAELAQAANIAHGFGAWQAQVEEPTVGVVAIAVPPHLQPTIARRALELGKPVF